MLQDIALLNRRDNATLCCNISKLVKLHMRVKGPDSPTAQQEAFADPGQCVLEEAGVHKDPKAGTAGEAALTLVSTKYAVLSSLPRAALNINS